MVDRPGRRRVGQARGLIGDTGLQAWRFGDVGCRLGGTGVHMDMDMDMDTDMDMGCRRVVGEGVQPHVPGARPESASR